MIVREHRTATFFALLPLASVVVSIMLDLVLEPFYLDSAWRHTPLLNFLTWHISIFSSIELIQWCLAFLMVLFLCLVIPDRSSIAKLLRISLPINLGVAFLYFLSLGYLSSVFALTATAMTGVGLYKKK